LPHPPPIGYRVPDGVFEHCRACNGYGSRNGPCVACDSERAAWFRSREEQALKKYGETGNFSETGFYPFHGEVLMYVRNEGGSISEVVLRKDILEVEGNVA
jgi:hypothetical protein